MPGIQEFNLGGGGSPASPEDVYPLMERMIASMDSAADRIGANIRQSMMTNQANQQAKSMASQATQLLQNPQTSTNPTALLTGMMQIATNNPLGSQVAGGQTVLQTLGSRAQAATLALQNVNPYYTPPAPNGGSGQPTGVGALDTANGGIASGVVPSGSGSPSGMIPMAPTAGPMAQPNVQVNGQQMQPAVSPGQSTGPGQAVNGTSQQPSPPAPDPVAAAAGQAVQAAQNQVAQSQRMLIQLMQNPRAKATDVERAQSVVASANRDLVTALDQQSKIGQGVSRESDVQSRFQQRMTQSATQFNAKRQDTQKYRDQVQTRFQSALDEKTKTGSNNALLRLAGEQQGMARLKIQGLQRDITNYQSEIKRIQNSVAAIQYSASNAGQVPNDKQQALIDSLTAQIPAYQDQIDGANGDIQGIEADYQNTLAEAKAATAAPAASGTPPPDDKVLVQKNGKQFKLPKSQLEDAQKQGYSLVQ